MRKEYCVYKHTCITNGKIYIGITRKDLKARWLGGSGYVNNKYFYRAIEKYGWNEGFIHEILFKELSEEVLIILFLKREENIFHKLKKEKE